MKLSQIILRLIPIFLVFGNLSLCVANESYIVYSKEEMDHFKTRWKHHMQTNKRNIQDPTYQMKRALLTVSGDDADYIPKVQGAGEIFYEPHLPPYQLMHNGIKIIKNSYYDAQWLTDVIYGLKGHHEPQEEKCFYEILKHIPDGATMIELGSYWAYYSLWFAHQVKNANNYLIEPDPHRLEVGKRNFALNNKKGKFFRGFVGVVKDDTPNINGASYISLDEFIEQENIDHVHILHADIQGGEFGMLQSAIHHLDQIDYFVISTHHAIEDHAPCLEFLKQHNLVIVAVHTCHESCSGDGLIVAKRKGVPGPDFIPINIYR